MNVLRVHATAFAALAFFAAPSAAADATEAPSSSCSYYAAPTRAERGEIPEGGAWGSNRWRANSFAAPGTVGGFWKHAAPGATLCLRSGTYRGAISLLVPPGGLGGAAGTPITVRALADGEVWFDGEHENNTVTLTGAHWVLEGFNAYDSKSGVIAIDGRDAPAHDIIVRRVVAWRNPDSRTYANIMNVDVSFASDVLLEDVGCFGSARKCVQVHRSVRVTARRVWARWDGRWPHLNGNEFAFTAMYRTFDSLSENVLATSGGLDRLRYAPPEYTKSVWLIGTDRGPEPEDVALFAPGRDRHDIRMRTLGSIAYSGPEQRFPSKGVLMTRAGMKGSLLQDVAVSVPASSDRVILLSDCGEAEFSCRLHPGDSPNTATRLTLIGGTPGLRTKSKLGRWVSTSIQKVEKQEPVDIFTKESKGARVCHRYVDGHLTSEPLWPWPMNARILAATERSRWGKADVTSDIERLFGPIPAECRERAPAPGN